MNLDGIIEDYPNTSTPQNKDTFTNLANAILNAVCPIGKTEIFYDNNDHSEYLGFEWERTSIGKFPIGIDISQNEFNTIGKTGGAKTHTLIVNELPKFRPEAITTNTAGTSWDALAMGTTGGTVKNNPFSEIGGGQPHNNVPPYEVMALWRRVA